MTNVPTNGINSTWLIRVEDGVYKFDRLHRDDIPPEYLMGENYRWVNQQEAAVFAAAIIQGFEPPRGLHRQEKPAD